MIEFASGGEQGETKDDYAIRGEYRALVRRLVDEWRHHKGEFADSSSADPLSEIHVADVPESR